MDLDLLYFKILTGVLVGISLLTYKRRFFNIEVGSVFNIFFSLSLFLLVFLLEVLHNEGYLSYFLVGTGIAFGVVVTGYLTTVFGNKNKLIQGSLKRASVATATVLVFSVLVNELALKGS